MIRQNRAQADTGRTKTAELRLRRTVDYPVQKVFAAWSDPGQMCRWMGCEGVTHVEVKHEFRVGGKYQITMFTPGLSLIVTGEYLEIIADQKIVYTWTSNFPDAEARDTVVSVKFSPTACGTEITLEHTLFHSQKVADEHVKGWTASLSSLENFLS